MIYFIRDTLTGLVKIGFSDNPWLRLCKMQSDCPGKLELLGVVDGDQKAERRLHEACAAERVRGEWFRDEGEVSKAASSAIELARRNKGRIQDPRNALIAEMAAITGVSHVGVRGWLERGRVPGTWMSDVADAGIMTLAQMCRAAAENSGLNQRRGQVLNVRLEDLAAANAPVLVA